VGLLDHLANAVPLSGVGDIGLSPAVRHDDELASTLIESYLPEPTSSSSTAASATRTPNRTQPKRPTP
jgi:hypothetical protein